ncbi:MAG TPA: PadR family transcriptional regulator [Longimicrobiales bacterium]|nr:PadR family transcriptional regulator [Longimicrobiales bacterium]
MKKPWFYILLSLASRDRYGSDIQEDVRALSGGDVRLWPATLYGSLEELVERGWIRELDPGEEPADGTHRSRYYRIRSGGREALTSEVERTEAMARIARRRLEEGTA